MSIEAKIGSSSFKYANIFASLAVWLRHLQQIIIDRTANQHILLFSIVELEVTYAHTSWVNSGL